MGALDRLDLRRKRLPIPIWVAFLLALDVILAAAIDLWTAKP